jgi:hypothetical protein
MKDRKTQTLLNSHLNDALAGFLSDNGADLETVLNALKDAMSDAVKIHQNWASSQEELLSR